MKSSIAIIVLVLAAGALPVNAESSATAATPRERVEDFHETLIEVMRSGGDFESRYRTLAPAVRALFDIEAIARISLGRTWGDLSEAQREDFRKLMTELITATYAGRFDGYGGQRFETDSVDEAESGRAVVQTRLVRPNDDPVTLDYYFREDRVYNVVANGVSDLSLRRADYAAIIARDRYEALLEELRGNIEELRAGSGDA